MSPTNATCHKRAIVCYHCISKSLNIKCKRKVTLQVEKNTKTEHPKPFPRSPAMERLISTDFSQAGINQVVYPSLLAGFYSYETFIPLLAVYLFVYQTRNSVINVIQMDNGSQKPNEASLYMCVHVCIWPLYSCFYVCVRLVNQ